MTHTSVILRRRLAVVVAATGALVSPVRAPAHAADRFEPLRSDSRIAAPTTAELMRLLDARLQKIKPGDILFRTVVFEQIVAGEARGGVYAFQVSATMHDYSAGFPPNQFYGKTCLTKMEQGQFTMRVNALRQWTLDGTIALAKPVCKDNPAGNVSAFPLSDLPGKRLPKVIPQPTELPKKQGAGVLLMGEYACIGDGGRMLARMGFRLKPDHSYADLDGARGGKYVFDPSAAKITFHGGFLDGKTGNDVQMTHFAFSAAVYCQRWQ